MRSAKCGMIVENLAVFFILKMNNEKINNEKINAIVVVGLATEY